ncbi:MAG: exosortase/archaeosortase family protein [Gemmatimonadales bacterium]
MVATSVEQTAARPALLAGLRHWRAAVPAVALGIAFVALFAPPFAGLVHEWWTDPDAGHGLLLFPVGLWLAWRSGIDPEARPNVRAGITLLVAAVLLRALGSIAAELFTQRLSIWLAGLALVVYFAGWVQVRRWWLPMILLPLAIPLPAILTNLMAIPLQFRASQLATAMIHWRHMPVVTTGNVINLPPNWQVGFPGQRLFVAEACSGLRSLTALLALGVLIGGLYLRGWPSRLLLVMLAIPVAVLVNAIRIFLTAFLVYFVNPSWGVGALHRNAGWLMFSIAFLVLGAVAALMRWTGDRVRSARAARSSR